MKTLEERVTAIENRNAVVSREKAWETSLFRVASIATLIFICVLLFLIFTHDSNPLLHAFFPPVGYVISTQSLPFIKQWWMKRNR